MRKPTVSKYVKGLDTLKERFKERYDSQNPLHKGLQSTLNDLCSNMTALETVRQNPDSRMPKDGHTLNVSRLAVKLATMTEEMRDYVSKQAEATERGLAAEMASRSGLKPGGYGAEIRQRLHAMTAPEKIKAIQSLIEIQDGTTLSAIFDAPSLLTGLSLEDVGRYREQFFQTACPELVQARDVYRDLKSHIDAAIETTEAATNEYSDPLKLRDLEEREAASVAAAAQLEGGSHAN